MKLSTKGRYGLRAMVDLACLEKNGPVSVKTLAERQLMSDRYLEQLFAKLKKAELVTSTRGTNGGYVLARPSDTISVGDILRVLEGDLDVVDCATNSGECSIFDGCRTKQVWKVLNDSIRDAVDSIMLKDLAVEGTGEELIATGKGSCREDN